MKNPVTTEGKGTKALVRAKIISMREKEVKDLEIITCGSCLHLTYKKVIEKEGSVLKLICKENVKRFKCDGSHAPNCNDFQE